MSTDSRRRQLAAIHAQARRVGLDPHGDRDAYEQMLQAVAGVRSAGKLDAAGRRKVLDHLKRVGGRQRPRKADYPNRPHNIDRQPMLTKIEALLADMGLPWRYADAIAKRQTGIERVAWLRRPDHLEGVIAALHVEQEKRGLLDQVDQLCAELGLTRDELPQRYRLPRGWQRNRKVLRQLVDALAADLPVESR
ncbi:gp16 family protein [Arhodomonas sp. AD133]|uniref:gp16 family protein n=1 Tax=Arhodomonas sp. AD133 TaxID=3415009 RepID=UPI003EC0D756